MRLRQCLIDIVLYWYVVMLLEISIQRRGETICPAQTQVLGDVFKSTNDP